METEPVDSELVETDRDDTVAVPVAVPVTVPVAAGDEVPAWLELEHSEDDEPDEDHAPGQDAALAETDEEDADELGSDEVSPDERPSAPQ